MSEIDVGKELVQALINRISWLETFSDFKDRDMADLEKRAKEWQERYETEIRLRVAQEEKLEAAIEKLYEFIGLDRSEWG
jgi:hypothetical protein